MKSESAEEMKNGKAMRRGSVVKASTLRFSRFGGGDLTVEPGDDITIVVVHQTGRKDTSSYSYTDNLSILAGGEKMVRKRKRRKK